MRTAIIGPGALGSLFGALLTEGGLDVVLVDHRPERAAALRASGLLVEGVRGTRRIALSVTADSAALGSQDLVVVCVKSYATAQAIRAHRSLVGPGTLVWTVQNGIGNLEALAAEVGPACVLGGSTTMGANLLGPGRLHHAGEGDTFVGEPAGGVSERVEALARELRSAGLGVEVSPDIRRVIWAKLLVNAGINALTALLRVRNGVLVEHAPSQNLLRAAVREAVEVARSMGFTFDPAEIEARVEAVARRTGRNRSSMLADALAGRRTEIDTINGAIADLGDAPVNRTLADLVRALEATSAVRESP